MKDSLRRVVALLMAILMVTTCTDMGALADIIDVSGSVQPGAALQYVTYTMLDENGNTLSRQIVKNGDTLYAPASPSKDGYQFLGWSADNGATFQTFGVQTVTAGGEVTLRPVFAEVHYVFFLDDGGRVVATKEGIAGDAIACDVTFPVNADESITGWYTEAALANRVNSITLAQTNVTLYPKVEKGYWVTYDTLGGTYVEPKFYAPGTSTAAPTVPTKPGYTFAGWNVTGTTNSYTFGSQLGSDVSLTAVWTANTNTAYTVMYWIENADDSGYTYESSSTAYGTTDSAITLSGNQLVPSSHVSSSYSQYFHYTATNGDTAGHYDTGRTIAGDGSTVVNVYFGRNVYTTNIKLSENSYIFDRDEGNYVTANRLPVLTIGGASYSTTYTFRAKYEANISALWPTAANMTTNPANGHTTYYLSSFFGNGTSNASKRLVLTADLIGNSADGSNTTFIAYWISTKEVDRLHYMLMPVSGSTDHANYIDSPKYSQTIIVRPGTNWSAKNLEGFTKESASGNKVTSTASGIDYEVWFYYTRQTYTITFHDVNYDDKESSFYYEADISGQNYTPARPSGVSDAAVFQGWYTTEDCGDGTEFVWTGKTMPAHNIILYAKWALPTFQAVVYATMEGGSIINQQTIPYDGKVDKTQLVQPTIPDGYVWRGWCLRTGTAGDYTYTPFNFETQLHADLTLYPYYTSSLKYTVSYDVNGGSGTAPVDSKQYAQGSYADVAYATDVTAPAGKVFLSWNTQSDGQGASYYPGSELHMTDANVTLYAIYGDIPSTTTLTYHSNFPTDQTQTVAALINNEKVTLAQYGDLTLPAHTGYDFLGWAKTADATAAQFAAGSSVRVDRTGNNDLYAVWKIHQYSYTVYHYLVGTATPVADSVTGKLDYGQSLTAAVATVFYAAYAGATKVGAVPENLTITIGTDENANVVKIYYNVPRIISVNKVWAGAIDPDQPASIEARLTRAGDSAFAQTVTLNAANNWSASFGAVDTYNSVDGTAYEYTVDETTALPDGYSRTVQLTDNSATITNTYTPGRVNITVTKSVTDNTTDSASSVGASFTFTVSGRYVADLAESDRTFSLKNGESKTISVRKGYTYVISENVDGNVWTTTVDNASGASKQVTANADATVVFANTRKTVNGGVTLTKRWADQNNLFNKRSASVTLRLMDGTNIVASRQIDAANKTTDDNTWAFTFDNVAAYRMDGTQFVYTADEAEDFTASGYTKTLSGTTVTNTLSTVSLSGQKTWVDGENAGATRPDSITVHLMRGTTEVAQATTNAAASWAYTFANVPAADAALYTVAEDPVPAGYTASSSGLDVTNTLTQVKKDVTGRKTWVDAETTHDNAQLVLTLQRKIASATEWTTVAGATATWSGDAYTFANVDTYDAQGYPYIYQVEETQVSGYDAPAYDATHLNVTNKVTQVARTISVSKTWSDGDNVDGLRPAQVTVQLLQNGKAVQTLELNAKNGWAASFAPVDTYDAASARYVYTVSETAVNGYVATYAPAGGAVDAGNAVAITNTHTPATVDVTVTKAWRDGGNVDDKRPAGITLRLYADGVELTGKAQTVTSAATDAAQTITFSGLPVYKVGQQGQRIVYTVGEDAAAGYRTEPAAPVANGGTITNILQTSVTARKDWSGDFTAVGHPAVTTIRATLSASPAVTIADAEKSFAADGTVTWTGLDAYAANGTKVAFSVTEANVPAGYTPSYSTDGDTLVITNTQQTTSVTVTKTWAGDAGYTALRPDSYTITLLAGTVAVSSRTASPTGDSQTFTFTGLPVKDAKGNDVVYTAYETSMVFGSVTLTVPVGGGLVGGYAVSGQGTLAIVNTLALTTDDVVVTKTWNDQDNAFSTRPSNFTVELDGTNGVVKTSSVNVAEDNTQQVNFGKLPRYERGKTSEVVYTAKETYLDSAAVQSNGDVVLGYTAMWSGLALTNELQMAPASFTKVWDDQSNKFGTRPSEFEVSVTYNGKTVTESFAADLTSNSKTYTFQQALPANQPLSGTAADYVFSETSLTFVTGQVTLAGGAAGGYTATVSGSTITNTMATKSVSYTKTWVDSNNAFRPAAYTVELSADIFDTAAVLGADNVQTNASAVLAGEWEELPVSNYNLKAGTIVYAVAETAIGGVQLVHNAALGYTMTAAASDDGTVITNTLDGLTTFTVNKVWLDLGDKAARPAVTMQLKANGADYGAPATLTNDTYTWENLPAQDAQGNTIAYSAVETMAAGAANYKQESSVISGTAETVTNRLYIDVTGTKTWSTAGGAMPADLDLTLLAGGVAVTGAAASWNKNDTTWTYTFANQPATDLAGNALAYTVRETLTGNYLNVSSDGKDLVNTNTIDVSGAKTWVDAGNAFGQRPASLTINLYGRDKTTPYASKLINGTGDVWSYSFSGVPYADDQGAIPYTVTEDTVSVDAGYRYQVAINGYNLTNTLYGPVTVTKVWSDNGDQDGLRAAAAAATTLTLDGVNGQSFTLTTDNTKTYTFTDLPLADAAGRIAYTPVETGLPAAYASAVSGLTVTNTHTPATIARVTVTKTWNDQNNNDGLRPLLITVTLSGVTAHTSAQQVGVAVEIKPDANDAWSYTWTNLPKYRNHGELITYSVAEAAVSGYTTTYVPANGATGENGDVALGITNAHTNNQTEIKGTKTWVDGLKTHDNAQLITLTLKRSYGTVANETVPNAQISWNGANYSFGKLDDKINGQTVTYTVEETVKPEGYTTTYDAAHLNVTNTQVSGVVATKVWHDSKTNAEREALQISLTLHATANGQTSVVNATPTVTESGDTWSYNYGSLPTNDAAGNAITYSVTENNKPAAYDVFELGLTVHNYAKVSVSGAKVWDDAENQDGIRPAALTVTLTNDMDSSTQTADLTSADWTYSWTNLTGHYLDNGTIKSVNYTVTETAVPAGYSKADGTSANGYALINTHTPDQVTITVAKVWNDANDQDGYRPTEITATLSGNNATQSRQLTAAGNWASVTFTAPKNAAGQPIQYTVSEGAVAQYTTTYSAQVAAGQSGTVTVTNTHVPETIDITVNKTWVDDNNNDGKRPTGIDVTLTGTAGNTQRLTANDNWTYTWHDMPVYAAGRMIEYSVSEASVEDYTLTGNVPAKATGASGEPLVFALENTHTNEQVSVSGTKTWVDAGAAHNNATEVTLTLTRSYGTTQNEIVTATPSWSGSTYTFSGLNKYLGGSLVAYTVREAAAPAGYQVSYNGNDLTNTQVSGVVATKVWHDSKTNAEREALQISLTLHATANGQTSVVNATPTVTENGDTWSYNYGSLPTNDAAGNAITYSVTENNKPATYDVFELGLTVHNYAKVSVSGAKVWEDAENQDGIRPATLTVTLTNDMDSSTQTADLTSADWTYSWTNLTGHYLDNGTIKSVNYTVTETAVPAGYSKTDGTSANGYALINTHTPDQVTITVAKVWNDVNDQDGYRPTEITATLSGNNATQSRQLTAAGNWASVTFTAPKNAAGQPIQYTVSEGAVAQYTTTYSAQVAAGQSGTVTVTNTHVPETIDITVNKTWVDDNNNDGKRPTGIDVTLTGAAGDTQRLTASGNWTYTWHDMPVYAAGRMIEYSVSEASVEDYTLTGNVPAKATGASGEPLVFALENTHTNEQVSVSGTKTWVDAGAAHNNATEVTLTLTRSYGTTQNEIVTATPSWSGSTYTFSGLNKYLGGSLVAYTVREAAAPAGYQVSYNGNDLTNTQVSGVVATKVWHDSKTNAEREALQISLTLHATANGQTSVVNATPTVTESGDTWSYNYGSLPTNDAAGNAITYSVTENNKPATYDVFELGLTVHNYAKVSVSGAKVWEDAENQDGIRPATLTVTLTNDMDSSTQTADLTSADWTYSWTNLTGHYLDNGTIKSVNYTVTETAVPAGYSKTDGTSANGYALINTHTPDQVTITVAKVWNDANDQDGYRPTEITATLSGNNATQSRQLTAAGNWASVTFTAPKNAAGQPIQYTVSEGAVAQYTTTYSAQVAAGQSGTVTVTNTHVPETIDITAKKTWANLPIAALAPANVTVRMTAAVNGASTVDERTLNATNNWQYVWADKPVYKDGTRITYTVEEIAVDGQPVASSSYTLTATPTTDASGNLTVTLNNTLTTTTSMKVVKTWVGTIGESVVVGLYNGATKIDEQTLNAAASWTYTWNNLPTVIGTAAASYSVRELSVDGTAVDANNYAGNAYKAVYAVNGTVTTITNRELTSFTAEKAWVDAQNSTHGGVTAILYELTPTASGTSEEARGSAALNSANGWTYTWTRLEKYGANGQLLNYTAREQAVPAGFHADYAQSGNTATITNTRTTSVTATKVWVDGLYTGRPTTATIALKANGVIVTTDLSGNAVTDVWTPGVNVTINVAGDTWTRTYTNLPQYDASGAAIVYTVTETVVPAGYAATEQGLRVTNTRLSALTGTKTWLDGDLAATTRPDSLTLAVESYDATAVSWTTVPATAYTVAWDKGTGNIWTYTITGLPYGTLSAPINYRVSEGTAASRDADYEYVSTGAAYGNFTNTLQKKETPATKTWDSAFTGALTVELYRQAAGSAAAQKVSTDTWTAQTGSTWTHVYASLPVFSPDNARYTYFVKETAIDRAGTSLAVDANGHSAEFTDGGDTYRFAVTASGLAITNTLEKRITAAKTWNDQNNLYATRPLMTTFAFSLLGDSQTVATAYGRQNASDANVWDIDFGFQKVSEGGTAIVYTVDEASLPSYDKTINGLSITNALRTVDLAGTKTWIDGSRAKADRPGVNLIVLRDGVTLTGYNVTWTNTDTDVWSYAVNGLPEKDAAGRAYGYTVSETMVPVPGSSDTYTVAIEGSNLTNRIDQRYVSVGGRKDWVDPAGTAHGDVTVNLLQNGTVFKTATVTDQDPTYAFNDLPKYDDSGAAYAYTVEEVPYNGYTGSSVGNATGGLDFTNVIDQVPVDVTVTKTWDDDSDRDGLRQDVTLELLRDGQSFSQTAGATTTTWTVAKDTTVNTQTYTFTGLDKYYVDAAGRQSHVYQYTVVERTQLTGYTTSYGTDGLSVTNTHEPELTALSIAKLWADDTNRDGLRTGLASLTFTVDNDGDEQIRTATIVRPAGNTTNDWGSVQVTGLHKYWQNGTPIVYTVSENDVPSGYTVSYAVDGNTTVATNAHTLATTSLAGTKTWYDGGIVHDNAADVTLVLNRTYTLNGQSVTEAAPNAQIAWNGGSYAYDNLPQYLEGAEGVTLTYTVAETAKAGYLVRQTGNDFINLLSTDVTITLNWVDGDQFYRPTTNLRLDLQANGVTVDGVDIPDPRTTGTTSSYTFRNVPAYDANGPITYTVFEPTVPGNGRYDAAYNGLIVTNTAYVTVDFVNYNGALLKASRILIGDSTTVAATPYRVGYQFTGWTGGVWQDVVRDQIIRANYITVYDVIQDPNIPLAGGTVQNVGDCFD